MIMLTRTIAKREGDNNNNTSKSDDNDDDDNNIKRRAIRIKTLVKSMIMTRTIT